MRGVPRSTGEGGCVPHARCRGWPHPTIVNRREIPFVDWPSFLCTCGTKVGSGLLGGEGVLPSGLSCIYLIYAYLVDPLPQLPPGFVMSYVYGDQRSEAGWLTFTRELIAVPSLILYRQRSV